MVTAAKRTKPRAISLEAFPKGRRTDFYLPLYEDALGNPLTVPFIVARGKTDGPVLGLTAALVANSPNAVRQSKRLVQEIAGQAVTPDLLADTADRIAAIRASDEGREGVRSFLEKRAPAWRPA